MVGRVGLPEDLVLGEEAAKGGKPQMARVATTKVQKVQGIFLRSPPILRMSVSLPMAWITLPAPRKSRALKKAWVIRWKMPAA